MKKETFLSQGLKALGRTQGVPAPSVASAALAGPLASGQRWASGVATVLVWLAAGAVVAYGVMHGMGRGPVVALPAVAVADRDVDPAAVARALGARSSPVVSASEPAPVDAAGRYSLLGVVAPATASESGVALVVVDGQRPVPYRVGAVFDGRWVVTSVSKRSVALAPATGVTPATAGFTLTLPEPH